MNKLPHSRKKHNFSLQGLMVEFTWVCGFQHLAAPGISFVRVGE